MPTPREGSMPIHVCHSCHTYLYTPCITTSPALLSSASSASSFDYIFFTSRSSIDQKGAPLAATCRKELLNFLFSIFFGYLRGDTPILKASFAVGVRVRPEGKGGLFDDNLPPILPSRPVLLSHLIQSHRITRAYHQSEILPPPLLGWARRWSEPEKKRRREMKREGILSGRAAGKSFAEGRSFNGNGRSVL